MTTPRVVLHIGYPKTGTTALQQTLDADRWHLAESGICYPSNATFQGRHARLAWSAMALGAWAASRHDGTDTATYLADIRAEAAEADLLLLSAEEFAYQHPSGYAGVLKGLGAIGRLSVVVYLRPQVSAIASMFRQLSRHRGYEGSLERFVEQVLGSGVPDPIYGASAPPWDGSLPPYDYDVFVRAWTELVPDVVVRPYTGSAVQNIVADLFAGLEAPVPPGVDTSTRLNETAEKAAVDPALAGRIRRHFAASNERLAERWLPEARSF